MIPVSESITLIIPTLTKFFSLSSFILSAIISCLFLAILTKSKNESSVIKSNEIQEMAIPDKPKNDSIFKVLNYIKYIA